MNVVGYCRVSTDTRDQLNSYENQHSFFIREISQRGHTLSGIYADRGLTGTVLNNRPDFERMLTDAGIDVKVFTDNIRDRRKKKKHTVYEVSDRKPLFDEIWIKNTSRFARNTLSYEIITKLRQKNVSIFFIEQNINTRELGQDLLLKMMQIFDEQDSKDKSLKVRSGNKESAIKNVVRTSGKLYGYKYIQHENRLVIIPEEAEIVRLIFDLYSKGYGTRRIINELRKMGVKTRNGKEFGKTTVRRIVDNEKYAGINNPLKYDTGIVFEKIISPRVKSDYITMENKRIEPIITSELFYKCKAIKDASVGHASAGIYRGVSKYASLIYCGRCGSVYYCNKDEGRVYYNCKKKKTLGYSSCPSPNVYIEQIDSLIADLANDGIYDIIGIQKIHSIDRHVGRMEVLINKIDKSAESLCAEIMSEIEETQRRLDGFYELYAMSKTNKDAIRAKIDASEQTLASLQERLSDYSSGNVTILNDIKALYKKIESIMLFGNLQKNYTEKEVISYLDKIIVSGEYRHPVLMPHFAMTSDLKAMLSEDPANIKEYVFTEKERNAIIKRAEKLIPD